MTVPPPRLRLNGYPSLANRLNRGDFPNVAEETGYLFAYSYWLIRNTPPKRYPDLERRLFALAEAYRDDHPEFARGYAENWGYQCMLAQRRFGKFLALTRSKNPFLPSSGFYLVRRFNVQFHIGRGPDPQDLIAMARDKVTPFTKKHPEAFVELFRERLSEDQPPGGSWLNAMHGPDARRLAQPIPAFSSVPRRMEGWYRPWHQWPVAWVQYPTKNYKQLQQRMRLLIRETENRLRDELGVPHIGEGWVSETALFRALEEAFPATNVVQHGRPAWLGRQHFDIWLPNWKIAVEYHGLQHFQPVEHFGGEEAFQKVQALDQRKARKARRHGVTLIIATKSDSHEEIIARVVEARREH